MFQNVLTFKNKNIAYLVEEAQGLLKCIFFKSKKNIKNKRENKKVRANVGKRRFNTISRKTQNDFLELGIMIYHQGCGMNAYQGELLSSFNCDRIAV